MTTLAEYLALAASYDGCGAQHDPERFGALVCPHGPDSSTAFFLRPNVPGNANSSCGVVAVGILAAVLRAHGRCELQYPMDLLWWQRAVDLAKAHGAYRTPGDGWTPGLGCIYHVAAPERGQHWRTVVKDLGGGALETIDGGGTDAQGYQLIHRSTVLVRAGVDVTSAKSIVEGIDCGALFSALGLDKDADPADSALDGSGGFGAGEIA